MILGFTGTREGMTNVQRNAVADWLRSNQPLEIHHGDCVGADSEFQDAAMLNVNLPLRIETHPCDLPKFRAHRKADKVHPVKPPMERNRIIVRTVELLLAAPQGPMSEQPRSGTWATVRLALSFRTPVIVVWPDGIVQRWGASPEIIQEYACRLKNGLDGANL